MTRIIKALLLLFAVGSELTAAATNVVPPRLAKRTIAPNKQLEGGPVSRQFTLKDGDISFTLFVPNPITSAKCRLTVHFHTVPWFVIQEHVRRGATHPLACFQLGEGSSVYRRPFEDRERFARCLRAIETQLRAYSGLSNLTLTGLELSSFSAGYAAIREIVKSPNYFERTDAIVLADSMYGSFETNAANLGVPAREHIDPWVPFAQAAREGKKAFLVSYSNVPTTAYASSRQCAEALLDRLELKHPAVDAALAAALDPDLPLLRRTDIGRLYIWGYGGTNAQAHLTHVRHLADLWRALVPEGQ
jgi:hypothetical protein